MLLAPRPGAAQPAGPAFGLGTGGAPADVAPPYQPRLKKSLAEPRARAAKRATMSRAPACGNPIHSRQHLIPDFLIGAHAGLHADRGCSRATEGSTGGTLPICLLSNTSGRAADYSVDTMRLR